MTTPTQPPERVIVRIAEPSRYAAGWAARLDGRAGAITQRSPRTYNGLDEHGKSPGPAVLVVFDAPIQPPGDEHPVEPIASFWFPACDLAPGAA